MRKHVGEASGFCIGMRVLIGLFAMGAIVFISKFAHVRHPYYGLKVLKI
jgi:hypothetical protein